MPESLKFVAECEPWNIYRLEDGTTIKARLILSACTRSDERGPEGESLYMNKFQIIQDVEFPDGRILEASIKAAAKRGGRDDA